MCIFHCVTAWHIYFPIIYCNSFHMLKSILLLTNYSVTESNAITCTIYSMSTILILCILCPSSFFCTVTFPFSRHSLADHGSLSSIINAISCIHSISLLTLNSTSSLATIRSSSSYILPLSVGIRTRCRTHT